MEYRVEELAAAAGVGVDTIRFYQGLGCWNPAVEISRGSYETALDVFLHSNLITRRHDYEDVVVAPPAG